MVEKIIQFKHKHHIYFLLLCVTYVIAFIVGSLYGVEDFHTYKAIGMDVDIPELKMSAPYDIFLSIVRNNLMVSLTFFISGLFSLGIFPIALAFYNGFIFGNVTGCSTHILSTGDILSATLPHFFEFIGLNLFGALGFYISYEYIVNNRLPKFKQFLLLVTVALSIVVLAAFLESFISI